MAADLALTAGGGTLPRVIAGEQVGAHSYGAAGIALPIGLGEAR